MSEITTEVQQIVQVINARVSGLNLAVADLMKDVNTLVTKLLEKISEQEKELQELRKLKPIEDKKEEEIKL